MKLSSVPWVACLLTSPVLGSGLVGISIFPYEPPCAFACLRSLSSYTLDCSKSMVMGVMMDEGSVMTSPQCRASNTLWLTTLAWCMQTQCAKFHVATSEMEGFWEEQCTGDPSVVPKWGYTASLENIAQPPTRELAAADVTLNFTALVSLAVYRAQYNALTAVQWEDSVESRYGYIIVPNHISKTYQALT